MTGLLHALERVGRGAGLTSEEMAGAVAEIMEGSASDLHIAALLTGLHVKGETADELGGTVRAVRARMTPLDGPFPPLLDTCGTGGDGASTVNISTATALVASACGVPVAKHGNRSASGSSGSAEVLAELGVSIDAETDVVRRCLQELGITFLFAPRFHPALRFAAAARKQLPFRTLFNLVGPLVNPASPHHQLIGIPDPRQAELIAATIAASPERRAAVVTGSDHLDEVTLSGPTQVLWVEQGGIESLVWKPDDFGLPTTPSDALRIAGPSESAHRIRGLLAGETGALRDVVLANTAAALWVAGSVAGLAEGVTRAAEAIDSGCAQNQLDRWIRLSSGGR